MKKTRKYAALMLALLCGCSGQPPARTQSAPSGVEITAESSAKLPETFVLSLADDYEPPEASSETPEHRAVIALVKISVTESDISEPVVSVAAENLDRKSTRLNSSH